MATVAVDFRCTSTIDPPPPSAASAAGDHHYLSVLGRIIVVLPSGRRMVGRGHPWLVPRQTFFADSCKGSALEILSRTGAADPPPPESALELMAKGLSQLSRKIARNAAYAAATTLTVRVYVYSIVSHCEEAAALRGAAAEEGGQEPCSICLDSLVCDQHGLGIVRTPCSHLFHKHCILRWLERSRDCPLCRSSICSYGL